MDSIVIGVAGVLAGGLFTLIVSHRYFVRTSRQLSEETSKLRKLVRLVLRGFEESGLVEFTRDKDGEIIGLVLTAAVNIHASAHLRAEPDAHSN